MATETSSIDPEVRGLLITMLIHLDDVQTDERFWSSVFTALESLETALVLGDPAKLDAVVRQLGRASADRANKLGTAVRPMPSEVAEKRVRLLHRLGGSAASTSATETGVARPPRKDRS